MLVADIMTRGVLTLSPHHTLRDAIELLQSRRIRHIPVVSDSHLVGMITDRDVKRATPSLLSGVTREDFDRVLDTTSVTNIMTREPSSVAPSLSIKAALRMMLENRFGALPVVDQDKLVGIVTDTDLLRAFYEILPDVTTEQL